MYSANMYCTYCKCICGTCKQFNFDIEKQLIPLTKTKIETMKKPSIGRIVIYNTTEKEQETFSTLSCNVSKQLPATIVAVWGETCINAKVQVDGLHDDLWKTSISQGDAPGQWNWPVIE